MHIFFEIHKDLPREGPGDNESTRKAYQLIEKYVSQPTILDIGCGPGMQTIEIAKLTDGNIIATDINEDFLNVLADRAKENGLSEKISIQKANMRELPFAEVQFDVIWAEGSIYIIGFEQGIKEWKKYLKKDGVIAVTEISWLNEDVPEEPWKFWKEAYPEIDSVSGNIKKAADLGFKLIDTFVLPESAWWDEYYRPLEERLERLREKYQNNPQNLEAIDETQSEIDLYRNYHEYYSYVFYLFQK